MSQRHDAHGAIQRGAVVVAVPFGRRTAVHGHPHAEDARVSPVRRVERELRGDGRGDRDGRLVEHGEHPVAGRLDHGSAQLLHTLPQQLVVSCERTAHRVAVLLPQTRRTLDVGEQECQCPRAAAIAHAAFCPSSQVAA